MEQGKHLKQGTRLLKKFVDRVLEQQLELWVALGHQTSHVRRTLVVGVGIDDVEDYVRVGREELVAWGL